VGFVTSIDEDLARRDFTVNAIAFDPVSEQLIDPFGGLGDLQARRLRAVGEPSQRFAEDGLRVLRAARFVAALEFELDAATAQAIAPSLDTYRQVSAERIHDEWNKTLRARAPSRGFVIMYEHGLLEITAPELAALATRTHPAGPALSLALRRVDLCPAQLELRLAALLCDLDASASRSAELADALLGRLRYANAERKTIGRLIRAQRLPLDPEPSDPELRRWLRDVGPDLYQGLVVLARAGLNAAGEGAASPETRASLERLERRASEQLEQKAALSLSELAIDGKQLMRELDLRPGPHVGKMLAALLDAVLEDPALNTRERLLERARGGSP
jgi:tRNA nucleotidyltransferase (CCA-adding enzyme)